MFWIATIVARAAAGDLGLDIPWSAYSVVGAALALLAVESQRARRRATA